MVKTKKGTSLNQLLAHREQKKIILLVLFLVVIYSCFLSLPSVVFLDIFSYKEKARIFLFAVTINFVLLLSLAISRTTFLIANFLYIIIGGLVVYYMNKFHIQVTYHNFMLLFETSFEEKIQVLPLGYLLLLIFFATVFTSLIHFIINKFRIEFYSCNKLVLPSFAIIFAFFFIYPLPSLSYPNNILRNIAILTTEKLFPSDTKDFDIKDITFEKLGTKSDKNLNVVLVIGESVRADRFQINGYNRETTPRLMLEDNVVSFLNFYSCGTLTAIAIPCMVFRYESVNVRKDGQKDYTEKSIISLFNKLDFNTSSFGNQKIISPLVFDAFNEASFVRPNRLVGGKRFDHEMLDEVFERYNSSTNNFYVIHLNSNHFGYSSKYPEDFKKFTPRCEKYEYAGANKCTTEEVSNDYDNGILYNDFLITKIIDFFKDKNTFMIFSSDHGESLGEDGNWFHSDHPEKFIKEQSHVAAVAYASDEFIKNNGKKWSNLKQKKNKELNQYYIFHSIADCVGISGDIINKEKSLCAE